MQDPPVVGIKGIAVMQGAPVVPNQQIADAPLLVPGELGAGSVRPQLFQQYFGLFQREPVHIRIGPASKVKTIVPGFRMCPNDRMTRAGTGGNLDCFWETRPQFTRTCSARVILDGEIGYSLPQLQWQSVKGQVHVGESRIATNGRHFYRGQK